MDVTLDRTKDSGIRGRIVEVSGAGVITVMSVSVDVPDSRIVVTNTVVINGIGSVWLAPGPEEVRPIIPSPSLLGLFPIGRGDDC
jgi:hypothetical protein